VNLSVADEDYSWNVFFFKNGKCHNILATRKRTKEQTPIYKTLHIKLINEKHEPTHKTRVNSCAAEG
jgi:hypothetical protein